MNSVSCRDKGAISYKLFTQDGRLVPKLWYVPQAAMLVLLSTSPSPNPARHEDVCGQPACESPRVARCLGGGLCGKVQVMLRAA